MAGRIPQHFIDELLARVDIVEVVGSRVALKRSGRESKGCCPFHNEKSPSFYVNPVKQFYHCFGCGAHGTAISFLMEHDHLGFIEAVEELAGRAGLEIPREGPETGPKDRRDDDLQALMTNVTQHYRTALGEDERARTYLKQRGLTGETVNRFALGFARNSWDDVLNTFGATPAGREALMATGMLIERDAQNARGAGHYDRFRDRVMFPIRNIKGECIGFGGRVLGDDKPKYLNSPETPVFSKGRELYGLFEARMRHVHAFGRYMVNTNKPLARIKAVPAPHRQSLLSRGCRPDRRREYRPPKPWPRPSRYELLPPLCRSYGAAAWPPKGFAP